MSPKTSPPAGLRELAAELAELEPMRRGAVSKRFMKCGTPGCRCHEDPNARHGPYYILSREVDKKKHSRYLSEEQAALAKEQIEAGQKFRRKVEEFWQGSEEWADQQLEGSQSATASSGEAEKRGSLRSSRAKSRRKSKPS
jgi:hypothetical protein